MARTSLRFIACAIVLLAFSSAYGQTITWKGYQWNVTNGGMAGVAPGDPANVQIDANGYLHLGIIHRTKGWTASELFTANNLGFGVYQWVVEGDVYNMDKSTVLGLFTYGPANGIGVDGEDEIDIEFSKWDNTCGICNADFTVYPSTGNRKSGGAPSWEDDFHVSGGNLTTARMEWSSDRIKFTIMKGVQPIGTAANILKTLLYSSNTTNIPQDALPVGINLWCFQTPPARNQSVVIRDFQFSPQ
ncbi:MAG TPA: glycoside hydrolase family 16 protein [Verrucomicrobiae bacterium]|jgi:hypothetical protein|nr:glycoside hydrolase family 16 protein [Verrucomicrobiae bacterium]